MPEGLYGHYMIIKILTNKLSLRNMDLPSSIKISWTDRIINKKIIRRTLNGKEFLATVTTARLFKTSN